MAPKASKLFDRGLNPLQLVSILIISWEILLSSAHLQTAAWPCLSFCPLPQQSPPRRSFSPIFPILPKSGGLCGESIFYTSQKRNTYKWAVTTLPGLTGNPPLRGALCPTPVASGHISITGVLFLRQLGSKWQSPFTQMPKTLWTLPLAHQPPVPFDVGNGTSCVILPFSSPHEHHFHFSDSFSPQLSLQLSQIIRWVEFCSHQELSGSLTEKPGIFQKLSHGEFNGSVLYRVPLLLELLHSSLFSEEGKDLSQYLTLFYYTHIILVWDIFQVSLRCLKWLPGLIIQQMTCMKPGPWLELPHSNTLSVTKISQK